MKKFLFFAISFVVGFLSFGQTLITLGTEQVQSPTTFAHPYSGWNLRNRLQFVYTASELSAAGAVAGSLSSFSFRVINVNTANLNNYEIRIGHTLESNMATHINTSTLTVKNAHTLVPGSAGWYTITFDEPFIWNGVENIVMDICYVRQSFTSGSIRLYNDVPNQTRYFVTGSTVNQCQENVITAQNAKPHARFVNTAAACQIPNGISASNITATTATIQWNAPPTPPSDGYQYEVRTSGAPGSGPVGLIASGSTTSLSAAVTGLTELTDYYIYLRSNCGSAGTSPWTLSQTFKTMCTGPLSGTYTINKNAPASATNFISPQEAIQRLIDCGVNGPVTLSIVAGTGPYTGKFELPHISGTSATNTITIQGNGNTIQQITTSDDWTVIHLNGAKHYILDSITVKGISGGTTYMFILFTNADSNVVRKCIIDPSGLTGVTVTLGITFSNSVNNNTLFTDANYNRIENNEIGTLSSSISGGIRMEGGNNSANNIFERNKIINWRVRGIEVRGCQNCLYDGNEIARPTLSVAHSTSDAQVGFYLEGSAPNAGSIVRNNIIWKFRGALPTTNTQPFVGMSINGDNNPANPIFVYNNLVEIDSTSGEYLGVTLYGSFIRFFHNTVLVKGMPPISNSLSCGLRLSNSSSNLQIKNNLLYLKRSGSAFSKRLIEVSHTQPQLTTMFIDHNVYEFQGEGNTLDALAWNMAVGPYYDLAAWRAFSDKDTNSIENDPIFTNPTAYDFTPQSQLVNNVGANLSSIVPTDLIGQTRPATPDPGALEFIPGTCVRPSNMKFSNIQHDQATLQWSENGLSTTWQIEYGLKGFTPGTGTLISSVTSKPYILTGLTELTEYDVYVRSICSSNTHSDWSRAFTFRTICGASLNGSYTINKNLPASSTNFTSFTQAINRLIDCGVSGPVTFNVAANSGPYNEQIVIPAIGGASSINTITFNGNGNTVEFNAPTLLRYVLYLNGADHIVIDSLRLKSLNPSWGIGVLLNNKADSNIVRNCVFDMTALSTPNSAAGIAMSASTTSFTNAGDVGSYNTFEKNTFFVTSANALGSGITIYGASSTPAIGNVIRQNTITNAVNRAIDISHCRTCIIETNSINNATHANASTTFTGIFTQNDCRGTIIRSNLINRLQGTLPTSNSRQLVGIRTDGSGLAAQPVMVYNNIIDLNGGNGTYVGINQNSTNASIYHNTILIRSTGSTSGTSDGISITSNSNNQIRNNIIFIDRDGIGNKVGIRLSFSSIGTYASNHNVIHIVPKSSATAAVGFYASQFRTTLTNWNTATGQDQNSSVNDPVFADLATFDYAPTSAAINNIGSNLLAQVPIDFFGVTRTTTPDPGAIEFSPGGCVIPSGLSASSITATSALLDWTENGSSTVWQIEYGPQGFTLGTGTLIQNITVKPYSLTGLTELTNYSFYVRSDCGNSVFTGWEGPYDFQTICGTPLSGSYTINQNAAASATNFTSFTSFAFRLNNCGVSGPVTVSVVTNSGPYVEKVVFNQYSGASSVNTVTILGNGNTLSSTTNASDMTLIHLNGADHMILDSLAISTQSTSFAMGIRFSNQADSNTIRKCRFNFSSMTSPSISSAIVFSSSATSNTGIGANGSYNLIEENEITSSGTNILSAVSMYGISNSPLQSNIIRKNKWTNTRDFGIVLSQCANCLIEGNAFTRPDITGAWNYYAISTAGSVPGLIVSNNSIHSLLTSSPSSSGVLRALDIQSGGTAANPVKIYNNIIDIDNGTGLNLGINISSSHVHIFHNTVNIRGTVTSSNASYGMDIYVNTNIIVRNNIFSIERAGTGDRYGVRLNFASMGTSVFSNNAYYIVPASATNFGVGFYASQKRETLSDWQSATGQEQGGVAANPQFVDPVQFNFTPTSGALDNIGFNLLSDVPKDYFGIARTTTPDPGAIEFSASSCTPPSSLTATNIQSTSAQLSWVENNNASSWEIEWGLQGFTQGNGQLIQNVSTNPYILTGLQPGWTYSFYVRTECAPNTFTTWVGPHSFTTPQIPVTVPTLHTFESGAEGWVTANETNGWYRGTAAAFEGTAGLYISQDAGVTNTYNTNTASVSHAWRDISFSNAPDQYLRFMWKAMGESGMDRLRVWLVPTSFTPIAGNQITSLSSGPAGRVQIGSNLSGKDSYTTFFYQMPMAYHQQTVRIVLEWINNNTAGTQPPISIDNFEVNTLNSWTGNALNNQWNTASNWSQNSVPTATSSVLLPTGALNYPNLTGAVQVRDMVVDQNAPITVQPGGSLQVHALLRMNSNITLQANASGYAGMLENQVEGSGLIIRQMYLNASTPPNNGRWYTIGSPFAVPINQLHDGTSEFNVTNATESPFRQWNASTGDYELPTGPTMNFERGRGYVAFFGEFVGSTFIRPVPGNITVTGNYGNAANVTRLLGYTSSPTFPTIDGPTDGWNLLANPYLTSYDWNGQTLGPNTGGAIYVRNAANTGWVTWNTSETSNRRYIPPMQGFWIRTTLSENLTFDIAQRSTNSTQVIEKPSAQEVLTRIKVTNTANGHDDRAVISFHNDGSVGFDRLLDGYKLRNDAGMHNVYSRSQNLSLALNCLPAFSGTASVPVWFENDQQGTYTFAINRDDIDPSIEITLEDKQTNTTFTFQSSQSVYTFTHTPQMGKDRFILHYNKVNIGQDEYTTRGGIKGLQAWYFDGRINLKSLGFHGPVTARLVDVSGKRIAEEVVTISAGELTRWNVPSLKPGVYMVQLITREGQSTVKFVY